MGMLGEFISKIRYKWDIGKIQSPGGSFSGINMVLYKLKYSIILVKFPEKCKKVFGVVGGIIRIHQLFLEKF